MEDSGGGDDDDTSGRQRRRCQPSSSERVRERESSLLRSIRDVGDVAAAKGNSAAASTGRFKTLKAASILSSIPTLSDNQVELEIRVTCMRVCMDTQLELTRVFYPCV